MNMLNKYFPATIIVLLVSVGACGILSQKEDSNGRISVNNDLTQLNQRITVVDQPITFGASKAMSLQKQPGENFNWLANVDPLEDNEGNLLSATSVDIKANNAYISYHLNGSPYGGAIEIIDLKDASSPKLVSQIFFDDTDINDLKVNEDGKKLWFTGGRDVHLSGYEQEWHHGAIIGEISINNNQFDDADKHTRETALASYSGNAIVEKSQELYVASGATGGAYTEVDKNSLEINKKMDSDYAKYVERYENDIIGLSLSEDGAASFKLWDFENDEMTDYPLNISVDPVDGKNVVSNFGDITYAALGQAGVKGYKFDGSQNDLVYEYKVNATDAANGVAADGKYVYIANGVDGLYITTYSLAPNKDPEEAYDWKAESDGTNVSANFVKTDGHYIIVAYGKDGVKILKRTNNGQW